MRFAMLSSVAPVIASAEPFHQARPPTAIATAEPTIVTPAQIGRSPIKANFTPAATTGPRPEPASAGATRTRRGPAVPTSLAAAPPPLPEAATVMQADRGTAPAAPHVESAEFASAVPLARGSTSRWAGDSWLVARPDGGQSLAFGQLGASQVGGRLTYAVDAARRVRLSARASTPLRGSASGREAAAGVDWRPTDWPVHLLVEARLPLDGGAAAPAAQVVAGIAGRLPFRMEVDAYGQAGAVHRRGGFADGAIRVGRALAELRVARIDLGAGAWGAAQRGAARLDVGPTLGILLPAKGRSVRLSMDYRARIAGQARPGSGPALTLGSSF